MNYFLAGLNHRTASVAVRERFAQEFKGLKNSLVEGMVQAPVQEIILLSTCNRFEIYAVVSDLTQAQNYFTEFFSQRVEGPLFAPEGPVYFKRNDGVVSHLFSVASSFDSQVVGENQITGQVREAYQMALNQGIADSHLSRLFERALFVAKRARSETEIGRGNVSIGSVSVVLAKKIFGSLQGRSLVLLGAGEIGKLVVRHIGAQEATQVFIINRTLSKADGLAAQGLGVSKPFAELSALLTEVDILITALSDACVPELSVEHLKLVMKHRGHKPLFIIDLGLPRNVPSTVADLDNVYLYNLDDLNGAALENRKNREKAMRDVQRILEEEVSEFCKRTISCETLPAISRLGKKFETIRQAEYQRAMAQLAHLSQSDAAVVERLTQAIVNRVIHDPVIALRKNHGTGSSEILQAFRKIFRLDDDEDEE